MSLLRQAALRLGSVVEPANTIVVTSKNLIAATRHELPELPRENLIAEPCRRDTAAAIAVACGMVRKLGGENAVAAVLTADQLMSDPAEFRRALRDAAEAAATTDSIVTIGIKPDSPSTGFGYIAPGTAVKVGRKSFNQVKRFAEKPDAATARRYVKQGYLWNSGMSMWRVATLRAALAKYTPALAILEAAVADAKSATAVMNRLYPQLPRISFDYAVLEKFPRLLVKKGDFGWDDVGSWTAMGRHFESDENANIIHGEATVIDSTNSVVVADGPKIALMGLKDVVVVSTRDSVLVCARKHVQELKKLVNAVQVKVK